MSRGPKETRADLLAELAQELRQFNGLSASFFRAMAARLGVTATDMQVIESLATTGPMTAGQLAELTGLTTGAITGMINRLEEAGLVRRERDPQDGRRVIVSLSEHSDRIHGLGPIFDFVGKSWEELAAHYDDAQIALFVAFLKRGNAVSREELSMLRAAPTNAEGVFSAPLDGVTSGRLLIPNGIMGLRMRGDMAMTELYRARFEGTVPEVKTKDGVVSIRYPRRMWMLGAGKQNVAEVMLNTTIPWEIAISGGGSAITAELEGLDLTGLEIKGGMSMIQLDLPMPTRVVPIRLSGGASGIRVLRAAGVPAQVHLKGWASGFTFDDQTFGYLGKDVRLHSPGYDGTTPGYDIDIASSASAVAIATK